MAPEVNSVFKEVGDQFEVSHTTSGPAQRALSTAWSDTSIDSCRSLGFRLAGVENRKWVKGLTSYLGKNVNSPQIAQSTKAPMLATIDWNTKSGIEKVFNFPRN